MCYFYLLFNQPSSGFTPILHKFWI